MQGLTGGNQVVQVEGSTVRQIINNLELLYPGTKARLYDAEEDELLPGVAAVVDGDASQLGLMERVNENSEVHFLPAIGGGGWPKGGISAQPLSYANIKRPDRIGALNRSYSGTGGNRIGHDQPEP